MNACSIQQADQTPAQCSSHKVNQNLMCVPRHDTSVNGKSTPIKPMAFSRSLLLQEHFEQRQLKFQWNFHLLKLEFNQTKPNERYARHIRSVNKTSRYKTTDAKKK